jgi:hypothetical protein
MSNLAEGIEHVNVKIFAREPLQVHWSDLIPIYHRWIQAQTFSEMLPIDVADYSHVPAGPGVMLIGHHADISLDNRANRVGLLYNRKTARGGSFEQNLRYSYERALDAARKLEDEPEFRGSIAFDQSDVEVFIADRLAAPNTEQTWRELRTGITAVFGPEASLQWNGPGRELFRVRVKSAASLQSV